jgi:hypothetical protein
MTALSRTRARLPLRTFVAVFILAKCARLLIWLARERPDSVLVPIVRRIVESAERLAGLP